MTLTERKKMLLNDQIEKHTTEALLYQNEATLSFRVGNAYFGQYCTELANKHIKIVELLTKIRNEHISDVTE